jgi:GT2 family glycosyltransferase
MVRTGAVNVGGLQVPEPQTPFEEAVAAATTSRLGAGGATYRVGGAQGPVDTVYLGVFDRAAGEQVGWFDETLIRNQDYELNIRLRRAGGQVWFDPELSVGYRPRRSWAALAKQYYEYGYWKFRTLRMHPTSVRPRQLGAALAAPAATVSLCVAARRRSFRIAALTGLAIVTLSTWLRPSSRAIPVVLTTHCAWSVGFLTGAMSAPITCRRVSKSSR